MKVLTGWPVPLFMALVFAALISTSDASLAGTLAATVGLVLVLLFWAMFREASLHAEVSRALAVGDGAAAAALADRQLARRRGPRRAPFEVYRALAHELRGEWSAIESLLGGEPASAAKFAGGQASWRLVAACVRVGALAELGEVAAARALYDEVVAPRREALGERGSLPAVLTEGRLCFAEGELVRAREILTPLTRSIRLGPAQRAMAFHYLARCAERGADAAETERLVAQAAALAPSSWFASLPDA
ncbi:MAG: hypothetical protein R3B48_10280 [Kofleriaceae bacterium]